MSSKGVAHDIVQDYMRVKQELSRHLSKRLTSNYSRNSYLVCFESFSQFFLSMFSRSIHPPNSFCLSVCYISSRIQFPRPSEISHSSFSSSISDIFFMCSKEKMSGIYARRIVALMADFKMCWDLFFAVENKRIAMSPYSSPLYSNHPVSRVIFPSYPNPTFTYFINRNSRFERLRGFFIYLKGNSICHLSN